MVFLIFGRDSLVGNVKMPFRFVVGGSHPCETHGCGGPALLTTFAGQARLSGGQRWATQAKGPLARDRGL